MLRRFGRGFMRFRGGGGSPVVIPTPGTTAPTWGTITLSGINENAGYGARDLNTDILDDGGETLTFAVISGSLPAGISLNSNGTFTGTTTDSVAASGSVTFRATNSGGFTDSNSVNWTVTVANDPHTGVVSIAGSLESGNQLIASNTFADPDGLGTVSYNWTSSVDNHVASLGTASTYTTVSGDEGNTIRVTASYTDGQGFDESDTDDHGPITVPVATGFFFTEVADEVDGTVISGKVSSTGNVTWGGSTNFETLNNTIVPVNTHGNLITADVGQNTYNIEVEFQNPVAAPADVNKWYLFTNYVDASNYIHVEFRHDESGGAGLRIYRYNGSPTIPVAGPVTASYPGVNFTNLSKVIIDVDGTDVFVWLESDPGNKATLSLGADSAMLASTTIAVGTWSETPSTISGAWAMDNLKMKDSVPIAGFPITSNIFTTEGINQDITITRGGGGAGTVPYQVNIAADPSPGNYWNAQSFSDTFANLDLTPRTHTVVMNAEVATDDGGSNQNAIITFSDPNHTDTGSIVVVDANASATAPTYTPFAKEDFESYASGTALDGTWSTRSYVDGSRPYLGSQSGVIKFKHLGYGYGFTRNISPGVTVGSDVWMRAYLFIPSTCAFSYNGPPDGDGWLKFLAIGSGTGGTFYLQLSVDQQADFGDPGFNDIYLQSGHDYGINVCNNMGGVLVPRDTWVAVQVHHHIQNYGNGGYTRAWVNDIYAGECNWDAGASFDISGWSMTRWKLGDYFNGAAWIGPNATDTFWIDDIIITADTPNTVDNELTPHPYIHPATKVSDFP